LINQAVIIEFIGIILHYLASLMKDLAIK